jgi:hypothetical protein
VLLVVAADQVVAVVAAAESTSHKDFTLERVQDHLILHFFVRSLVGR